MLPLLKGVELVAKTPHLKQLGQLPIMTAASCKIKGMLLSSNWKLDR